MSGDAKEPPSEYQLIGPADDGKISDLLAGKTAKEDRQRLQALIAEWLRMENVVVLAGAGTSVSSGGKTMNTLERATLEALKVLPKAPSRQRGALPPRPLELRVREQFRPALRAPGRRTSGSKSGWKTTSQATPPI